MDVFFAVASVFEKKRFKILQTESCRQHSGHHATDVDEEFLGLQRLLENPTPNFPIG